MEFTLYAAGASYPSVEALKKKLGYPQLHSQILEKKQILEYVNYKKEHPECQTKLFIDSGAFTAHTKGTTIDVDAYINFLNEIDDYITIFAQVDHIPGIRGQEKTIEQQLEAPKKSWENYLYMVDKVKSPKKLIPVFHQGEDFAWLKNMCEYQYADGSYIDYIGISCNKELTSKEWNFWFQKCFKVIHESKNPNVKTHAFGMTSYKVLEQFPFTSSDSTTWVRCAAFGSIIVDGKTVYCSKVNKDRPDYIYNQNPAMIEAVEKRCKELGFNLTDICECENAELRIQFNIASLHEWAKNYKYKGTNQFKEELW